MNPQQQNTSNDVFSQNLRHLLAANALTQDELSIRCGIPQGTISNYARGKREPTATQLKILANALGVTMEYLLTGQGPQPRASPAESGNLKSARAEAEKLARQLREAEVTAARLRSFLG